MEEESKHFQIKKKNYAESTSPEVWRFTLDFMLLLIISNMRYVPVCAFAHVVLSIVICNYTCHTHFIEFSINVLLESHLSQGTYPLFILQSV